MKRLLARNFKKIVPLLASVHLMGCGGGSHEIYSPPQGTDKTQLATISGEQYKSVGDKYLSYTLGDSYSCISSADNVQFVSGSDCSSYWNHTYKITAGDHVIHVFYWMTIGSFMTGGMPSRGYPADIRAHFEPGQTYVVRAQHSSTGKISFWLSDKDGKPVSAVIDRYTEYAGQTYFEDGSGEQKADEKRRVFVLMESTFNYGQNDERFGEKFVALAKRCQIEAEFYSLPHPDAKLSLNDQPVDRSEAISRIARYAPDSVLTIKATKQQWMGGSSGQPPNDGIFFFDARLMKALNGPAEWWASVWHYASPSSGGEQLASGIVTRFSDLGIFAHCPDLSSERK